MIAKRLILISMFLIFILLCTDAKRRGGGSRLRTGSSSDSSSESSSSPIKSILGTILFVFSCGFGIFCKFFKCFVNKRRHQQQTSGVDRFNELILPTNETHLASNRSNTTHFILIPIPVQLFDDASEKLIDKNELEQLKLQNSICPQQTINKEENNSVYEDVKEPLRTNY